MKKIFSTSFAMPKEPKKILLLGSGALKIGEAGEFDYSGSQAIKALKEEKKEIVLINPNIATNQTSAGMADKIYFLPVNPYFVEEVIKKEKPDSLLLSFGGQTALNCGVELEKSGVLKKYKVQVLGTPVSAIEKTEDREIFNKELRSIGVKVPLSHACTNEKQAWKAVEEIGYPVMVRAAYALGGKGSGVAYNKKELKTILEVAFSYSPQVLVEEYLKGWKEVEYEVVRDKNNNCITVCNMENMDPMGIHTGESIVVAPSQTLTNDEYFMLREVAQKVVRHLGIVGECNIQYALDSKSTEYRVIEVNARLSRSSALASKATGYPLAYVAAKLGLGYALTDLKNAVTQKTTACFEPALDYIVAKLPRWDLDKFRNVSQEVTSEMKSVGEVMAIGRSFEEVIQKGLRMLNIGVDGLSINTFTFESLKKELSKTTPRRIFAIAKAIHEGWTLDEIHKYTDIDIWFLEKIKNIVDTKREVKKKKSLTKIGTDLLKQAKVRGFADSQIARYVDVDEMKVRAFRKKNNIVPVVKQIDTLAAEFPAKTNYLYMTYGGGFDDAVFKKVSKVKKKKTIVLGSGCYCIGSSVEFDWCGVTAITTLKKAGHETVMINCNPETVSTDYDICDQLYFEELTRERVLDVYDKEDPTGMILSMGGQIPNSLAMKLKDTKLNILGTSPEDIDMAENRHKFSALLDELDVDQPLWKEFKSVKAASTFANKVGYPVLVRPSYVLSGAAMSVAHNDEELQAYLSKAARVSSDAPVVISKFELNAKEIEMDAVAHNGELLIWAIAEHVENAGVHSGDATIVLPPQKLYLETIRRVRQIGKKIAKGLNITGPFNIQFLAKNNRIKVIECNLRASRSFPFASKVTGHNFIEIAVNAMMNKTLPQSERRKKYRTLDLDHVGVKAAQFSFSRLKGADPVLGVEMASTGEVACFGDTVEEAFLKSLISVGLCLPMYKKRKDKPAILFSIGQLKDKISLLESAKKLANAGYRLFATENTAEFFKKNGIKVKALHKIASKKQPNIDTYLEGKKLDLVINIPKNYNKTELTDGYHIRRKTVDSNIPLFTNVQIAKLFTESILSLKPEDLQIKSWEEYMQ